NDVTTSEVRLLAIADAEELGDTDGAPSVDVDGINARVFTDGDLAYVVTSVRTPMPCPYGGVGCYGRRQQVQVVDLASGAPKLRGKLSLPVDAWGWGWGLFGYYWRTPTRPPSPRSRAPATRTAGGATCAWSATRSTPRTTSGWSGRARRAMCVRGCRTRARG